MKVVIEARLRDPAAAGGVSQAIISLATSLSGLGDHRRDEEYVFVVLESAGDWLDKYVRAPCRIHKIPMHWKERLSASPLGPLARGAWDLWRRATATDPLLIGNSDGTAENMAGDLVHFPTQDGYLTALPTIYQPHDLQHLHMPQLFNANQLAWRNTAYPLFCQRAAAVLVESTWTKNDVTQQLGIPADKIVVAPFPPATGGYIKPSADDVAALRQRLAFGEFIFYPAQTWPHKNHLALIEALARLRDESGMSVPLICSGKKTDHYEKIRARLSQLGMDRQVQFLGYVSDVEIRGLYELCTAVVVPTKFESVSFPVWEALEAGKAVACSNTTSLPAQVGDAGLIFDPDDPASIAAAVKSLWGDAGLRTRLGEAGRARFASFSLDHTARRIRALYRKVASSTSPEDENLLAQPPLV